MKVRARAFWLRFGKIVLNYTSKPKTNVFGLKTKKITGSILILCLLDSKKISFMKNTFMNISKRRLKPVKPN